MKKLILICVGGLVIVAAAAVTFLGIYAEEFIQKYQGDIMGLAIRADDVEINWLTYGVTLKGVKIYPSQKEKKRHLLASADEVHVYVAPLSLLAHTVRLRSVVLVRPEVSYIRTRPGHTNWAALNMSWLKDDEKEKGAFGSWRLRVDRVAIKDGRIIWKDRMIGASYQLNNTQAELSNIVHESDSGSLPSDIEVQGTLGRTDAKAWAKGRVNLLAEGANFDIDARITNAPITYFAPFYAGQVPFRIVGGAISVKSDAKALKNMLTSSHHATIRDLKVGGVQGKLINALILRKGNRIEVSAQVNGDLSSGNLRVSSQISRIMGGAILAQAGAGVPLRNVGEGLKQVGEKAGSAVRRLFRRR